MPIYVYQAVAGGCPTCQDPFEKFHGVQTVLASCPECDVAIRRLIMPVGMAFPAGPAALRNMGMARLEKRSDGSYENVSAQSGGQRTGSLESFSKSLTSGDKPIIRG